jgi:hypothetical protein
MPEWSDSDLKVKKPAKNGTNGTPPPRKRTAKQLQPDATQMDSITQAQAWLKEHPEEAAMLRAAQISSAGDILSASGVPRYYSSTEAAAFFDKTVQWLYWGMRHPPHGGRLFVEPEIDPTTGEPVKVKVYEDTGEEVDLNAIDLSRPIIEAPKMRDIPVERLDNNPKGKRRFDIPTIRKFAISAYHQANIKEPKLRAVLERLVVAERGGNWKSIPIPTRKDEEPDEPA